MLPLVSQSAGYDDLVKYYVDIFTDTATLLSHVILSDILWLLSYFYLSSTGATLYQHDSWLDIKIITIIKLFYGHSVKHVKHKLLAVEILF